MIQKRSGWMAPALAVLALADAAYLAMLHWRGESPPCGGYLGCEQVNNSPYAEIFGLPIAAFGALLFAVILGVSLWRWRAGESRWPTGSLVLYSLTLAAAIYMAYLTGIELFVLRALCYWCIALAIITLLLLALVTRDIWELGSRPGPSYSPSTR